MSLLSVPSNGAVLFALEMNQGWFAQHGIKAGDSIKLLDIRDE